ncbi:amino acid transporter protein [Klebsormidium nitens]|uniref:Amino acid transporter protein n=1 Tax=Klebsormidium nitens TaxID=105231 RepID=A0A1Y1HQJ5_KLENI|nr:amino acid transporter protein [Klebsormidium nitens]|eukprot:GAQ79261.1 amino acid transporter protein [Klebsormidium nitens]
MGVDVGSAAHGVMGKVKKVKAIVTDTGEKRLRELGYKQELSRTLGMIVNFAVSYTIIGVLMGITGLYSLGFSYGGPVSVIWGWVTVGFFSIFIALSMAELTSSLPTAGGLYFWSYHLAGPKWGPIASWITGWFNYLGFVCGMAVINSIGANVIATQIVLSTGPGGETGYVATKEMILLFMTILAILQGIINSFHVNFLAVFEKMALYIEIAGLIIICVTLLSISDHKQSAKFVFTQYEPAIGTGVNNKFYVFLIGLLMSQFTLLAYDAATHLTEETVGADWTAPIMIVSAVVSAAVAGFLYLLVLTFCIQDPLTILDPGNATAGLNAVGQIFYDAFVSKGHTYKGAIALLMIPLLAAWFSGVAQLAATSRVLFAVTRDKAVPFSKFLHWSPASTHTPIVAVWVSVFFSFCFSLFILKNSIAFNAVTSASTIGAYIAYTIPIALRLVCPHNFHPGPFHLGWFSYVSGTIAVVYMVFMCVVFCLPISYPIDSNTFNYTPVTAGAVTLVALILWFASARKYYKGPVRTITTDESFAGENYYKDEMTVHGEENRKAPPVGAL